MNASNLNQRARRNEADLRNDALNQKTLPQHIFTADCKPGRGLAPSCPNDHKCRNKFLGLDLLIIALRQRIYCGERDAPSYDRRKNLRSILTLGCREVADGRTVGFSLGGVLVCKTFFRDCVGMRRQLFDEVLHSVFADICPQRKAEKAARARHVDRHVLMQVLAILDRIFKPRKTKKDPRGTKKKISIRSSWRDVFDKDFKSFTNGVEICTLKVFCYIRRTYRPYYDKSPRLKKGK